MIDKQRRNSLKWLTAIAATVATSTASALATIQPRIVSQPTNRLTNQLPGISTPIFKVETTHSSDTNDIKIVVTNTTGKPATISRMFPGTIETIRGEFNFDQPLMNGPLTVQNGDSITIDLSNKTRDTHRDSQRIMTTSIRKTLQNKFRLQTTSPENSPQYAHILLASSQRYT